jgi:hypothetical protein
VLQLAAGGASLFLIERSRRGDHYFQTIRVATTNNFFFFSVGLLRYSTLPSSFAVTQDQAPVRLRVP